MNFKSIEDIIKILGGIEDIMYPFYDNIKNDMNNKYSDTKCKNNGPIDISVKVYDENGNIEEEVEGHII